jgi:hypothetical protein
VRVAESIVHFVDKFSVVLFILCQRCVRLVTQMACMCLVRVGDVSMGRGWEVAGRASPCACVPVVKHGTADLRQLSC